MQEYDNIDIGWKQRLANYQRAFEQIKEAVILGQQRPLSNLEKQGLIKAFEFTHELAWNVLKDFYEHQGEQGIQGSRDAIRTAFRRGLIVNGEVWMKMIKSRSLTSHTYNEEVTKEVLQDIFENYYAEFVSLKQTLTEYLNSND